MEVCLQLSPETVKEEGLPGATQGDQFPVTQYWRKKHPEVWWVNLLLQGFLQALIGHTEDLVLSASVAEAFL